MSDPNIDFSARVIAAGITPSGNARLTLWLNPAPSANPGLHFDDWPREIETWLAKPDWHIKVAPARTGVMGERPLPAGGTPVALAKILTLDPGHIEAVSKFWGGIAPSQDIWNEMAKVFADLEQEEVDAPYYRKDPNDPNKTSPQVLLSGRVEGALIGVLEQVDRAISRLVASPKKAWQPPEPTTSTAIVSKDGDERAEDMQAVQSLLAKVKTVADAQRDYLNQDKLATGSPDNEKDPPKDSIQALRRLATAGLSASSIDPTGSAGFTCSDYLDEVRRRAAKEMGAALHRLATAKDVDNTTRPAGALTAKQIAAIKASQLKDPKADPPSDPDAAQAARALLFAVRSYPVLARLFRFAVDVEVSADELKGVFSANDWLGNGHDKAFCFLSVDRGVAEAPLTWTLAKLKLGHAFWPATREEMELRLAAKNDDDALKNDIRRASCQLDGVVNLGQAACLPTPAAALRAMISSPSMPPLRRRMQYFPMNVRKQPKQPKKPKQPKRRMPAARRFPGRCQAWSPAGSPLLTAGAMLRSPPRWRPPAIGARARIIACSTPRISPSVTAPMWRSPGRAE